MYLNLYNMPQVKDIKGPKNIFGRALFSRSYTYSILQYKGDFFKNRKINGTNNKIIARTRAKMINVTSSNIALRVACFTLN